MKRRHGINTSVTVRSVQLIPPTGMPTNARQDIVVPTEHNTTGVLIKEDEEKDQISSQNVLVDVNEEKYDVECETTEVLDADEDEVVVSQNLQQILNNQTNQGLYMTVGSPMLGYYNIQGDVDLITNQR